MHAPRIAPVGLSLVLIASACAAGQETTEPPKPDAAPASAGAGEEPPSPLSGPTVKDGGSAGGGEKGGGAMAGARGSLVERDFDGKIKELEVRPEEAALALLDLTEGERKRCAAVLDERAALMDGLVREHIDLLLELRAARAGGDPAVVKALTKQMRAAFAPLGEGGGLLEKLAANMPKGQADKLRALTDEYYRAVAADERKTMDWKDAGPAGEKRANAAAMIRVALETLGQEIKRSYERMAAEGTQRLERLIAALELDGEQESAMRRLASDYAQKTKLNPTGAQRAELFGEIFRMLSPEQRTKFAKYLKDEGVR